MADCRAHPLHLVLAALVQRELDLRRAEAAGLSGGGAAVVELDALGQSPERGVGRLALDLGNVDLGDLVARVREPVRELAVVREQDCAGGVCVETSHRHDARLVRDELDDGRAAARDLSPW